MHSHGSTPALTAPAQYVSGWCGTGNHEHCVGSYAGISCGCPHHAITALLDEEPPPRPPQPRHCNTCTCGATS